MKSMIVLMLFGVAYSAQLDKTYLPPSNAATAGGHNAGLAAPFVGSGGSNYQQSSFTSTGPVRTGGSNFHQTSFASGGPIGSSGGSNFHQSQSSFAGSGPVRTGGSNFQQSSFTGGNAGFGAARPNTGFSSGGSHFSSGPSSGAAGGFQQSSFSAGGFQSQAQPQYPIIPITRYDSKPSDENGNYAFSYETGNGISAQENGRLNGAQGGYSYVGDNGQTYTISYTADENGFLPQGAHIPTPPPIPAEILAGLAKNAADEAAGIFDDGKYRGEGLSESQYRHDGSGSYQGGFAQQGGFNRGSGFNKVTTTTTNFNQGGAGFNQGGAGFNQGGAGFNQGGAGFNQGGAGYKQTTFNQGSSGFNQGGAGFNQGGASFNQGGAGLHRGGASASTFNAGSGTGGGYRQTTTSFHSTSGNRGTTGFQQQNNFGLKQATNQQGYVY